MHIRIKLQAKDSEGNEISLTALYVDGDKIVAIARNRDPKNFISFSGLLL